jgi:hypothetical protein
VNDRIEAPQGRPHNGREKSMSNKPTHYAYVVIDAKDSNSKAQWHRVGAVWQHTKGNGFDLVIPPGISVSGRIVCTEPKEQQPTD